MSVSDIGWRRMLFVGAGLAIAAAAIIIIFRIPPVKSVRRLDQAW
jgi:hypothetical protein